MNRGWEVGITSNDLLGSAVQWKTILNYAYNYNDSNTGAFTEDAISAEQRQPRRAGAPLYAVLGA